MIATTPRPNSEKLQQGQVLARLRHHRIVGRNHEQRGVDSRCTGHHRVNEAFMAREHRRRESRAVVVEMRESQLDRDAAAFFLGQSIHRAAGQRMDAARFAVVDMAGQANDELRTSSYRRCEHPTRPRNGLSTHVSCGAIALSACGDSREATTTGISASGNKVQLEGLDQFPISGA